MGNEDQLIDGFLPIYASCHEVHEMVLGPIMKRLCPST
jgi:hypothetical protein